MYPSVTWAPRAAQFSLLLPHPTYTPSSSIVATADQFSSLRELKIKNPPTTNAAYNDFRCRLFAYRVAIRDLSEYEFLRAHFLSQGKLSIVDLRSLA
jgi:hypothetical protein